MIERTADETFFWFDTISNKVPWVTTVEADELEITRIKNLFHRIRQSRRGLRFMHYRQLLLRTGFTMMLKLILPWLIHSLIARITIVGKRLALSLVP